MALQRWTPPVPRGSGALWSRISPAQSEVRLMAAFSSRPRSGSGILSSRTLAGSPLAPWPSAGTAFAAGVAAAAAVAAALSSSC